MIEAPCRSILRKSGMPFKAFNTLDSLCLLGESAPAVNRVLVHSVDGWLRLLLAQGPGRVRRGGKLTDSAPIGTCRTSRIFSTKAVTC
jgi:hypothetical protein